MSPYSVATGHCVSRADTVLWFGTLLLITVIEDLVHSWLCCICQMQICQPSVKIRIHIVTMVCLREHASNMLKIICRAYHAAYINLHQDDIMELLCCTLACMSYYTRVWQRHLTRLLSLSVVNRFNCIINPLPMQALMLALNTA